MFCRVKRSFERPRTRPGDRLFVAGLCRMLHMRASAIADARRSSAVRLQFAASLSFAMRRNRTSASGNGERGLTTHCRRSPIGRLVGRHCKRSRRSKTRCIDASVRDPPPSNFVSKQRIPSDQEVEAARDEIHVRTRALSARKIGPIFDATWNPHLLRILTDGFLNLRTAEISRDARIVVRETLHFKPNVDGVCRMP